MIQEDNTDNIYTVSQLTGLIKTMLQRAFPYVQIKGEISNFRPNSTGHLYFVLKDSSAQISAVMFRGSAYHLSFKPKDGMSVIAKGKISVYEAQGKYQIVIDSMTQAGLGDIMEMIEERKRKLAEEGLFDSEKKRPLPFFPKTIGVITSPTGAALRDILNIIHRRNNKVSVIVLPAQVQGDGAAETIIQMIQASNYYKLCDVLIIGRGGGSLEDLLPFSDEGVVRTIADSQIPTVSAVGHEIDWALSDFAADVRAPTPSAAAEIAIPELSSITEFIQEEARALHDAIHTKIQTQKLTLQAFSRGNMELQLRMIEQPYLQRFDNAKATIMDSMQKTLEANRTKLTNLTQTLENCNPQTIFDRGYSMVTDAHTGQVLRDAARVEQGTELFIRPSKGSLKAKVL